MLNLFLYWITCPVPLRSRPSPVQIPYSLVQVRTVYFSKIQVVFTFTVHQDISQIVAAFFNPSQIR